MLTMTDDVHFPHAPEEGILTVSEPVYLRFEHTIPPHHKFYEVEVDLCLFYPKILVRRWGRIGTRRPHSLRMGITTPEELQHQVAAITRRRHDHGYRTVAEILTTTRGASAA